MLGASVDFDLAGHRPTNSSLGEHAFNGQFDQSDRASGKQITSRDLLESAGPTGVMTIHLVIGLIALEDDLRGVNDNDVIAGVDEGSVSGFVLTHENLGDFTGQSTDGQAVRIDNVPITVLLKPLTTGKIG